MQYAYDGQIRRYVTQLMRLLSNFPVKDGKGTLREVPVMYGDLTRQVAHIIKDNSENKLPSAPRISVYITGLEQDRERTGDSSYTRSVHVREREWDPINQEYLPTQGANYTVERLMPTPFTLKANADIWASNTDQKLQIMEQLLIWFNPSIEIQTTDNFVDWTSLTVVNLESINWTNRTVPAGVDSEIDVGTLSFSIPIYISPPAKVKKMGVITNIITSIFDENRGDIDSGVSAPVLNAYDDVIQSGVTENEFGRKSVTDISQHTANVNFDQYGLYIQGDTAKIIYNSVVGSKNWQEVLEALPGNYNAGVSRIFANNRDTDVEITGTVTLNPIDNTELSVNWDTDSFPQDTIISSSLGDRTTVDYIVDPSRLNPSEIKSSGLRLMILSDIGNPDSSEPIPAWKNTDGSAFTASENDIIEWDGAQWNIIFDASDVTEVTYITNLNTNTQYKFQDGDWSLSVDGEYTVGSWRLDLYG